MILSNTGELNQLFFTFNRVWGAGGNASLNLKTVDGKVTALVGALLELQLGHPEDPRPGAKPEAEPVAAYQPHARRHRGPGRQARDNARRDAWKARTEAGDPAVPTSDSSSSTSTSTTYRASPAVDHSRQEQ